MKKFYRYPLFLALILVLLMTACGAEQGNSPTAVGTILPENNDLTSTPFGPTVTIGTTPTATGLGVIVTPETTSSVLETATTSAGGLITTPAVGTQVPPAAVTRTPGIPVTGQEDIVLVECQFCVDTRAHALLVLPDTATFQITSPAVTANTTPDIQPTCTTVEINNGRQVVLCSGPEMTPLVVNICTDASNCTDFPVNLLACPLTQGVPPATQTPGTDGTGGIVPTATPGTGMTATATTAP